MTPDSMLEETCCIRPSSLSTPDTSIEIPMPKLIKSFLLSSNTLAYDLVSAKGHCLDAFKRNSLVAAPRRNRFAVAYENATCIFGSAHDYIIHKRSGSFIFCGCREPASTISSTCTITVPPVFGRRGHFVLLYMKRLVFQ